LSIIQSNKKISRKQLSEILGINESAVQKHIYALKRKNIIERDSATTGQ
jgi:predicted ArsR family transcriptional regulator